MKLFSHAKYLISSLLLLLLTACGDGSNSGFPTADCGGEGNLCVSEFTITPNKSAILIAGLQNYQAIATLTDGSELDITDRLDWNVDNEAIATISTDGSTVIATGIANGVAVITGQYRGMTASAQLSVGAITFSITPTVSTILTEMQQSYQAFAIFPNGVQVEVTEQVSWASDNSAIATINVTDNLVTASGLTEGLATISASYNGKSIYAQLNVINSTAETLIIAPATAVMPLGTAKQYSAFLTTSSGEVIDVSKTVNWQITDTAVASIDATAWLTATKIGTTTVSADIVHSDNTLTASASLTVNNAQLDTVAISPVDGVFPVGKIGVYRADAHYADGSVIDVTRETTWSIADTSIGSIVESGIFAGDSIALSPGKTTINASFQALNNNTSVEVTAANIISISISPMNATTPVGTQINYQAHALYSDGSKHDITQLGAWSTSDPSIAAIEFSGAKSGVADALAIGSTNISVDYDGLSQTTSLMVSNAVVTKLQISPLNPSVPVGIEGKFTATAYYSDNTTVDVTEITNWLVDDYTVVAVVPTGEFAGYAKALTQGTTTLTASFEGENTSTLITVTTAVLESLSLTPTKITIPVGTTQQYQLFGVFSDGSNHDLTSFASYQSSKPSTASIDSDALAKAHLSSAEEIIITATYNGKKATAALSVSDGLLEYITVEPADQSIPVDHKARLQATAFYSGGLSKDVTKLATWSIDNGDIASVDNTHDNAGSVLGISEGVVTVTANFKGELAASRVTVTAAVLESVTITPVTKIIAAGLTQQYHLFAIYSDSTSREVTLESDWTSSEPKAATIDSAGLATTYQEWQLTITGTYQGLSASADLTITGALPSVLQITPVNPNKPLGTVGNFIATVFFTDGYAEDVSKRVTWVSSDTSVVQISASGSASAEKVGVSEITATFGDLSETTTATVTSAVLTDIYIDPVASSINIGDKQSYNAICKYSDGSLHNLPSNGVWQSSKTSVATVQITGVTTAWATGVTEGNTIITARVGDITSNEATLEVAAPTSLTSIQVTPAQATVVVGTQDQFTAIASYSDGSSKDITQKATWLTDNAEVVSIITTGENAGLAHALNSGVANIYAVMNNVASNTAEITVTEKTINNIQITPNNSSYILGETAQYLVTVIYEDNSTEDVTASAQIQSKDFSIATFDENNIMTTVGIGDVEFSTVYKGVSSENEFLHVTWQ